MKFNCCLCGKEIELKNERNKDCSVCEECFFDRRKTVTLCDVELSNVSRQTLRKLHHKRYIVYAYDEWAYHNDFSNGLDVKDIFLLNECKQTITLSEKERIKYITNFCYRKELDTTKVLTDKYVDAFISYNLIKTDNLKEFKEYIQSI